LALQYPSHYTYKYLIVDRLDYSSMVVYKYASAFFGQSIQPWFHIKSKTFLKVVERVSGIIPGKLNGN